MSRSYRSSIVVAWAATPAFDNAVTYGCERKADSFTIQQSLHILLQTVSLTVIQTIRTSNFCKT